MNEYTPETVARAEAMGHHENAEHMRRNMGGNVHKLPLTPYQVQQRLRDDMREFGEGKYRQGYAVGRWDGFVAGRALAFPSFLVGVGLGVIIAVVVGSSL